MPLIVGGFNMTDIVAGGKSSPSQAVPWQIYADLVPNSTTQYEINIDAGTVNQLLADNLFASFTKGEGTYFVKLKCDTNGRTVNKITVLLETTPISAGVPLSFQNVAPPTFYVTVGIVAIDRDEDDNLRVEIFQVLQNNLSANPRIVLVESKHPDQIGDEPFVRWYAWEYTLA